MPRSYESVKRAVKRVGHIAATIVSAPASAGLCAAWVAFGAAPAIGSPFWDPLDIAVFHGANTPSSNSITSAPATLTLWSPGWHIAVTGTALARRVTGSRIRVDADGAPTPMGQYTDTPLALGGTVAGWWTDSAANFALGLATSSPPAETSPNVEDWQYAARGGSLRTARLVSVAGGLQYAPVRAGFGVHFTMARAHLRFARDAALADGGAGLTADCDGSPCRVENPATRESWDFRGNSTLSNPLDHIGFTVNLGWDISTSWSVGLLYDRNPGISGVTDLAGTLAVTEFGGNPASGTAHLRVKPPSRLGAEVRGILAGRLELHAGVHWEHLAPFAQLDLRATSAELRDAGVPDTTWRPRASNDVWRIYAGVESPNVGQRVRVGVRGFAHSPETDAETETPTLLGGWEFGASGGVQLRLPRRWTVEILSQVAFNPGSSHTSWFDPTNVSGCASAGGDATNPNCERVRLGYDQPSLAGEFSALTFFAALGLRYDFR